uniref:Uncharacterized protein n=1 Tax=Chromera velia CCMP2878 TaxID=1169474 RepID=A0A0G4HI16_9ALVE|eukprot:Cvel_27682.t1-p1 / transcript=Cvel_27682.t1 / gene=Cvel_27682 / organism=Chromera_velia_CCMP2878 / gene_product=hypothetical protein / transcript_product=hypothetical protein / location=Cvel_scaffold3493:232-1376(+) / protein_length=184 / sequence_SO=supercontig / SO=protein_coding / is_pseudo=false
MEYLHTSRHFPKFEVAQRARSKAEKGGNGRGGTVNDKYVSEFIPYLDTKCAAAVYGQQGSVWPKILEPRLSTPAFLDSIIPGLDGLLGTDVARVLQKNLVVRVLDRASVIPDDVKTYVMQKVPPCLCLASRKAGRVIRRRSNRGALGQRRSLTDRKAEAEQGPTSQRGGLCGSKPASKQVSGTQ